MDLTRQNLLIESVVVLTIAVSLNSNITATAQELTLRLIDNGLIDEMESVGADITANSKIQIYYQQLPQSVQVMLQEYDEVLADLLVDYGVAHTAADSAEVTEIITDMNTVWIQIQKIYSESFTPAVIQTLHDAYSELYPLQ